MPRVVYLVSYARAVMRDLVGLSNGKHRTAPSSVLLRRGFVMLLNNSDSIPTVWCSRASRHFPAIPSTGSINRSPFSEINTGRKKLQYKAVTFQNSTKVGVISNARMKMENQSNFLCNRTNGERERVCTDIKLLVILWITASYVNSSLTKTCILFQLTYGFVLHKITWGSFFRLGYGCKDYYIIRFRGTVLQH